jgi:hypothetical protein
VCVNGFFSFFFYDAGERHEWIGEWIGSSGQTPRSIHCRLQKNSINPFLTQTGEILSNKKKKTHLSLFGCDL